MSTKESVLAMLEKNRNADLSGEEIAQRLGLSRAAVWKSVKALEQEGYIINAVPNRGYRLSPECGLLSVQAVEALLPEGLAHVHIYQSIDSTNNKAKELAASGCPHGTAIIAEMQTGGRGRRGRSFASPSGGLYMSVVLRRENLCGMETVTAAAAVAVCRAVQTVTGMETKIKWVNDVLLNGRKLCGILSEAVTDLESGGIEWVVAGLGVNLDRSAIPEDLREIAAALYDKAPGGPIRARLAAAILQNLLPSPPSGEKLIAEYRSRLSMLGRTVTVFAPDGSYEAVAEDIDESCRLIVRLPDGTKKLLSGGEVSVRET